MKITVQNLGAITNAEIEIAPLTVFVGPNNTGKTWLAYTIAGIFESDRYLNLVDKWESKSKNYPSLEHILDQALRGDSVAFDMVKFAEEYGEIYLNDNAHSAQEWMPGFMNTRLASFEKLDISIELSQSKAPFLNRILDTTILYELNYGEQRRLGVSKKRGERQLYIYNLQTVLTEGKSVEKNIAAITLPADLVKTIVATTIIQAIHVAFYPQVRILPTERTTALTLPVRRDNSELATLKIGKDFSQDWYTKAIKPVNAFYSMISHAYSDNLIAKREKLLRKEQEKYGQLARLLEDKILDGKVEFAPLESSLAQGSNQLEPGLAAELVYRTGPGKDLELSIASSMVKELAPLVLYLRDIANKGDLLIIDEPEKSLHPEAQVKMIEFLAMLVNAGLNIIITTHSPYVVDHLANLMKAYENPDKETLSKEFYLENTEALISKNNVSVYAFEKGSPKRAIDEDGVIQWNTFGEVSDRLADIYFLL